MPFDKIFSYFVQNFHFMLIINFDLQAVNV
jgi:hypothetical protein